MKDTVPYAPSDEEQWRSIPGFEDYAASNQGRIVSYKKREPRILATVRNHNGYLQLKVCADGVVYTRRVHYLVCAAFHGPRPAGMQVRHVNGDQLDNRPSNLAWGTAAENGQDKRRHGRDPRRQQTHCLRGHEFTVDNTKIAANRTRHCKTCNRERQIAAQFAAAGVRQLAAS